MIIGQSLARLWIVPDRQSTQRESTAEIMTRALLICVPRWYNSFAPPHGEFSLALPKQLMHHHVPPFELFNKHVLVTSASMYMTDFITLYHGLLNGLNLGLAGLIIMENLPLDHNEFALAVKAAPNNNNRWIEWDVPLGGEIDEPIGLDRSLTRREIRCRVVVVRRRRVADASMRPFQGEPYLVETQKASVKSLITIWEQLQVHRKLK
ncbi:hypothetical protein Tco_0637217 [Tanacetum coccineum]